MKLVKIDSYKNIFFCVMLLFVTFWNVIILFSNAHGEPINVNSLSNSSAVQDLNETTNSTFPTENTLDIKKGNKVTEKFFAQIQQINDSKAVIEVFPITPQGAVIKNNDSNFSKSNLLSLSRNDTLDEVNNTEALPPPPIISYIENEGSPMNTTNFVVKENAVNTSEEEDDDESNRNTSEEEDDDESNRNTSEQTTPEFIYKNPNSVPTNEVIGTKTIGDSIDNENDKLISQFSELNSSVIPNLQIQTDDSKTKDRKPIANAGLDQVITSDQNIVLDASASIDPEGKISSYLWKQIGNSQEKINTSNSMIYSFPIPEGLEENSLAFKLIVTDKKGQIDTDTINFIINHENDEKDKPN